MFRKYINKGLNKNKRWIANVFDYKDLSHPYVMENKLLQPLQGVGITETGALKNLYKIAIKEKKQTHTSKLILSLFHMQDQQLNQIANKSYPAYYLEPLYLSKIMYHLEQGSLRQESVKDAIMRDWQKTIKNKYKEKMSNKKIHLFFETILASKNECIKNQYPLYLTEHILLGFLYHKAKGRQDIIDYLDFHLGVKANSKEQWRFSDDMIPLSLSPHIMMRPLFETVYERFCFLILQQNQLSEVKQSKYRFAKQEKVPNCVEAAFQNLCNILLLNPVTGKFDFSLLPSHMNPHEKLIKLYEIQAFSPNLVNSPLVGQYFMDMVSGHTDLQYNRGSKYPYELTPNPDNFIPLMNYLFGCHASTLAELSDKFSTNSRSINFSIQKRTNDCLIVITLTYHEPFSKSETVYLRLTSKHGELLADRFAANLQSDYFARILLPHLNEPRIFNDPLLFSLIDKKRLKFFLGHIEIKDHLALVNAYLTYRPHQLSKNQLAFQKKLLLDPYMFYRYGGYILLSLLVLLAMYELLTPTPYIVILGNSVIELTLALDLIKNNQENVTLIMDESYQSQNQLMLLYYQTYYQLCELLGNDKINLKYESKRIIDFYTFGVVEVKELENLLYEVLLNSTTNSNKLKIVRLNSNKDEIDINRDDHRIQLRVNNVTNHIKFKYLIFSDPRYGISLDNAHADTTGCKKYFIKYLAKNYLTVSYDNMSQIISSRRDLQTKHNLLTPIQGVHDQNHHPSSDDLKNLGWNLFSRPEVKIRVMNDRLHIYAECPEDLPNDPESIDKWLSYVLKYRLSENEISMILKSEKKTCTLSPCKENKMEMINDSVTTLKPTSIKDRLYQNTAYIVPQGNLFSKHHDLTYAAEHNPHSLSIALSFGLFLKSKRTEEHLNEYMEISHNMRTNSYGHIYNHQYTRREEEKALKRIGHTLEELALALNINVSDIEKCRYFSPLSEIYIELKPAMELEQYKDIIKSLDYKRYEKFWIHKDITWLEESLIINRRIEIDNDSILTNLKELISKSQTLPKKHLK